MGSALKESELDFYKKVDKILYLKWDPIGIAGHAPQNEYWDYLPHVFKLALENTNPKLLVQYLTKVRTQTMGLSHSDWYDLEIAEYIFKTKKDIGL